MGLGPGCYSPNCLLFTLCGLSPLLLSPPYSLVCMWYPGITAIIIDTDPNPCLWGEPKLRKVVGRIEYMGCGGFLMEKHKFREVKQLPPCHPVRKGGAWLRAQL